MASATQACIDAGTLAWASGAVPANTAPTSTKPTTITPGVTLIDGFVAM